MSAEYDELDDLLDDEELYATIIGRGSASTANLAGVVSGESPDIGNKPKPRTSSEVGKSPSSEEIYESSSGLESILENLMTDNQPDDALRKLLGQLAGEPDPEKDSSKKSTHTARESQSFEDTISETMSRLKSQNSGYNDSEDVDTLAEMLKAIQGDRSSNDGPTVDGIDGILGTLLGELATKDVLYEPLKELHSNYPDWIARNEKSIDKKDLERYRKQQSIIASVVEVYESQDYSDQNVKYRDFITEKMSEMQSTGTPPPELVETSSAGGGIPGLSFDVTPPEVPSDCATQ